MEKEKINKPILLCFIFACFALYLTAFGYQRYTENKRIKYEQEVAYRDSIEWEKRGRWLNNSLSTGDIPYENADISKIKNSQIEITTIPNKQLNLQSYKYNMHRIDYVVIIKCNDKIVRNAYIKGEDVYCFNVPSGTYQVFFYSGRGWNPNLILPNGMKGGFVEDVSFSKDLPVTLNYQILTYELTPQVNGNFKEKESSIDEIFKAE